MLELNDPRWNKLLGGYSVRCNAAELFRLVTNEKYYGDAWSAFWGGLYHQGDIGEASIAIIPNLVEHELRAQSLNANIWAYVTTIEVSKGVRKNPEVPDWLELSYKQAMASFSNYTLGVLAGTDDPETRRYMLAFLLSQYAENVYSKFVLNFAPEDAEDVMSR